MSVVTSALTIPQSVKEWQALHASLTARRQAVGWSQNGWARRAGIKDSGFASRVLTGKTKAPGVLRRLVKVLEREERRQAKRQGKAA